MAVPASPDPTAQGGTAPRAPPPLGLHDVDLNHYRIGKIEGFEVLKKVKVRGTWPCMGGASVTLQSASRPLDVDKRTEP
ncbi:hypothetical protein Celaphus_00002848 [Cervus elaphus hippelaphus]|uniref:Uncharacterized protein n=1 Tax=Cervus elaphus hippelaphus TaxID=46360 RepID=A0A212CGK6_CEREH|nr:hypothetical protein Celaphus_00002848 [Cervus elaphus hippelaphus]